MMRIKMRAYFLLLSLLCGLTAFVIENEPTENDIKAAFIYKFTNYIDWDSLLTDSDFTIGIIGKSPIDQQLNEIAKTKTVKGKKITVRRFIRPEEITPCHILFIDGETNIPIHDILAKVDRGTLTIGEKEGLAKKGVQINFVEIGNKLRFEANPKCINAAGLRASSQLLKLAIIVN